MRQAKVYVFFRKRMIKKNLESNRKERRKKL